MQSSIVSFYIKDNESRIQQGDVLVDFVHSYVDVDSVNREIVTKTISYPYLIVMSQDCDLQSDEQNRNGSNEKTQDKFIPSILLCPAFPSDKVRRGEHLPQMRNDFSPREWEIILKNNNPRYHTLNRADEKELSICELIIDFKHYYTISRDKIYKNWKKHYKCTINELYREALSQRFAYFLSRVALPDLDKTPLEKARSIQETKSFSSPGAPTNQTKPI